MQQHNNDGNNLWSHAAAAGLGALASYGVAQHRMAQLQAALNAQSAALRDAFAFYEPLVRNLRIELAGMQQTYQSLQGVADIWRQQHASIVAAFDKLWAQVAINLEPSLPHLALPPSHNASVPTNNDMADELTKSQQEVADLKLQLRIAVREIQRLGGVVHPTDFPQYEWPDDSMPWPPSNS